MATKVFFQIKGYTLCQGEIIIKSNENILTEFQSPLPQNHRVNFNQTWHKAFLGNWDPSLFKCRATLFSKEKYLRNSKNTQTKSKNVPLQNHIVDFNESWHKAVGIHVCSNEKPFFLPKVDNNEIAKIN